MKVSLYKSSLVESYLTVSYGCKHGRPRGRGSKGWKVRAFTQLGPEAHGTNRKPMKDKALRRETHEDFSF